MQARAGCAARPVSHVYCPPSLMLPHLLELQTHGRACSSQLFNALCSYVQIKMVPEKKIPKNNINAALTQRSCTLD